MVAEYSKGEIVLVEFPFTETTGRTKKRPAMVVYANSDLDVLLCQITTRNREESEQIHLPKGIANLQRDCYLRTHKMTTVRKIAAKIRIGTLPEEYMSRVDQAISEWLFPGMETP